MINPYIEVGSNTIGVESLIMSESSPNETPLAMSPPNTVEKVTAAYTGVKQSANGSYVVPTAPGEKEQIEPESETQRLTPGTKLTICGKQVTVQSTGMTIIDSDRQGPQRYITKIGLNSYRSNRSAQLYVDRDPYLLNETRGPVWKIPTDMVEIE